MTRTTNPANSALPAQSWEISVSEKVRGGPGRRAHMQQFHGAKVTAPSADLFATLRTAEKAQLCPGR